MNSKAANLLQWLDANNDQQVMDMALQRLDDAGLGAGALNTSAALPIALQVDVTALACDQADLALEFMNNPDQLAAAATTMINEQLAIMQPAPDSDEGLADDPPTIRVSLHMTQAPLPLLSVPDVVQQAVQHSSSHAGQGSSCPQQTLVSLLGVVSGLTAPAEVIHSQRLHCPACGGDVDVGANQSCLPCCNLNKTDWLKEDVTGRVMVQTQQLYVSEFSSALGRGSYSISCPAVHVTVTDSLVSSCSLGDIVHVIGHAHITQSAPGSQSSSIQVHANNIEQVLPHLLWALPAQDSASKQQLRQQPLQHLWELLTDALGYHTPIDPHLALSLLLSAAAVGGSKEGRQQSEQVNLLVLHESYTPTTPRLLKEAAALLSPQSVSMPMGLAEHVVPITGTSSGSSATTGYPAAKAVFASTLHLANTGVVAAELTLMTNKSRQQLLEALQQRATPSKDLPPSLQLPALTATCWAAASWQDMCPADGKLGGRALGRGRAAAGKASYHGFDLCIGDATVYEDDLWALLDAQGGSPAQQCQQQQYQMEAAAQLRKIMASSAECEPPALTEAAQAFLGQYFLVVRQSVDGSSHVSRPHLLANLVRVASALARLHQRNTVLECPDAALAAVLMEQTLANKLGDAYHPLLDLPCDLCPCNGRSLDEQVQLLHSIISHSLRQNGFAGGPHKLGGPGAAGGSDEGPDEDSGCGGWDGAAVDDGTLHADAEQP